MGVPNDKRYTQRLLKRDDSTNIFKANSDFCKFIVFEQFLACLYDVGELFFNKEFDTKHPPEDPNYPVDNYNREQKFDIVLDWMGCASKKQYEHKMQLLGGAFNSEKNNPRIDPNDLS